MSTFIEASTLIAVDVGSINTRASLFDVVDGAYRLVATGRAPSTAAAPLFDLSEGVRMAIDQVQQVTGRRLVDENDSLIVPVTAQGSGTDALVATSSAGPRVRLALVGLMPEVSLESARRLAASSYVRVVEEVSLLDRRREAEIIDALVRARPDMVLFTGGTDGGATESVLRMADIVGLAVSLMPEQQRPRILYAGNRQLGAAVTERLGERMGVSHSPNVRPTLESEDLGPTRLKFAELVSEVHAARISGFDELRQWSGGYFSLAADSFGRVLRYMSQVYGPEKGVLGIDLGASQTTVAAAFHGSLQLSVRPDLGMGSALAGVLAQDGLEQAMRWLPVDVTETAFRDYAHEKARHPGTIPVEQDELLLEYALARVCLQMALERARRLWPVGGGHIPSALMPALEPVLVSGATLGRAPRPGFAALALLDAVQPTGITTLVLDPHNLLPTLGVIGAAVPLAAVQVLESGSFANLGTTVSPIGRARTGKPVLRYQLDREATGDRLEGIVRSGDIAVLPLGQGEQGKLTLRPERGFDAGFGGPGRAGAVRVSGGAVGLILDARGRPLELAKDPGRRREANHKWLWDIGAIS